ncbi:MAG TPA: hypothetical protein PLF42_07355 [Anaerolineales bacterium]|nr:hypothetical protein [Anaerolineales bacterium]
MARKISLSAKRIIEELRNSSDDPADAIIAEYQLRLRSSDDEATIVLVGHLIVENLINRVIRAKCKAPKTILGDVRVYTFAVKLQIIYAMGLLPEGIYKNIVRINKLRNKYAHNIEFDIDPNSMLINVDGKDLSFFDTVATPKKKKNINKEYIDFLCYITLLYLSDHLIKIGVDPRQLVENLN